jgi:hypothetical protein
MTDEDWARLAKVMPRINAAPLHIDTDPTSPSPASRPAAAPSSRPAASAS